MPFSNTPATAETSGCDRVNRMESVSKTIIGAVIVQRYITGGSTHSATSGKNNTTPCYRQTMLPRPVVIYILNVTLLVLVIEFYIMLYKPNWDF